MGQVLRVTVGASDHSFRLISVNISTPERAEIRIEWKGEPFQIIRAGRSWVAADSVSPEMAELAEAIGKAMVLRYRF